jgi:hypothetical protein
MLPKSQIGSFLLAAAIVAILAIVAIDQYADLEAAAALLAELWRSLAAVLAAI